MAMRILSLLAASIALHSVHGCTTIVVGSLASTDGSTISTHNADCLDCDFRIGKVPSADWADGTLRPVVKFRAQYPRAVSDTRGSTWKPENIEDSLPQKDTWTSLDWKESTIIGYIPEVSHTFASIEGLYGIINEEGVAIGESTCGSIFFAGPIDEDCDACNALFDISELTRIAMERASTAREAIQIMGDLAVQYGFYGSAWDSTDFMTYMEAAEALTVTDRNEAWVFHISSDDTSKSAVWAAQRVPDDHVSVVANQFIIRGIDPYDKETYMFSENLEAVATRTGLYDPSTCGFLDFAKTFGFRYDDIPHYAYSTRRVWRVLDLVAPSLGLSPFVDSIGDGLPFSVRPDYQVSPRDVLGFVRDHYEGTSFDLTQGLAAGPYGDPDRYDPGFSPDNTTTYIEAWEGGYFERSIGLFRTAYSVVTQSRNGFPLEVGAMVWLAQYKPSLSTFIPIYVAGEDVPLAYQKGSLFAFTEDSSYWAFNTVGNWVAKAHKYIKPDIDQLQVELEDQLFDELSNLETSAYEYARLNDSDSLKSLLTNATNDAADRAVQEYKSLFYVFLAKYHDGYIMNTPTNETIQMTKMFYPKPWLEAVGFFESKQIDEIAVAFVEENNGIYDYMVEAKINLASALVSFQTKTNYAFLDYMRARESYFNMSSIYLNFTLCGDISEYAVDDDHSPCKCYSDEEDDMKKLCKVAWKELEKYDDSLQDTCDFKEFDVSELLAIKPQSNGVIFSNYCSFVGIILAVGLVSAFMGILIGRKMSVREGYTRVMA